MNRDEEAKNLRLYDRRVVERNIKKGVVNRKDYDKYLKSLGDTTTNIASPEERMEEAPDDMDDEDELLDDDEPTSPEPVPGT
jgi:hypothetical protein